MKYLKNQQFEEILFEAERSKADPPPTKHKSYWGPFLLWKRYCIVWILKTIIRFAFFLLLAFIEEDVEKTSVAVVSGKKSNVIWCSKKNQSDFICVALIVKLKVFENP